MALLELAVAAAVAAMLAIWAASLLVNRVEDARAEATGRWLLSIRNAAAAMVGAEFGGLAGLAPAPAGYADPYAPTLAELQRAGYLAADFPVLSPFGRPAGVRILARTGCPGEHCRPEVLVTTMAAPTGAQSADPAATGQVLLSTQGHGGAVHEQSPGRLRGPQFDLPNPLPGAAERHPAGTVAVYDDSLMNTRYVQMRDSRDPDLQGELSVRGDVRAGGAMAAAGTLSGEALNLHATAGEGGYCAQPGMFSRTAAGGMLSCQGGRWAREDGGFGGAFSVNNRYGCRQYSGESTVNPRTGGCSCPYGYAEVIVSAGGKWSEAEGWTTGYVCVR